MPRVLLVPLFLLPVSLALAGCHVTRKTRTTTNSSSSATPPASTTSGKKAPAARGKKAPTLSDTSTDKDIAAYVTYYEGHGYTIKTNQQAFNPDGTVKSFHFAATRHKGANEDSASASIEAARRTFSTSEESSSTTTTKS